MQIQELHFYSPMPLVLVRVEVSFFLRLLPHRRPIYCWSDGKESYQWSLHRTWIRQLHTLATFPENKWILSGAYVWNWLWNRGMEPYDMNSF